MIFFTVSALSNLSEEVCFAKSTISGLHPVLLWKNGCLPQFLFEYNKYTFFGRSGSSLFFFAPDGARGPSIFLGLFTDLL